MTKEGVMSCSVEYFDYDHVHMPDVGLSEPSEADAVFSWSGSRSYWTCSARMVSPRSMSLASEEVVK